MENFPPSSAYQTVLSLHPSGKAVSLNPKFKLKTPITPQLLNGFMSDEAFRRDHSMYMHSRDFLPMPVSASPLLCMIMHGRTLFERYTDSFKTLSMLRTIVQCFAVNPFLRNDQIMNAHKRVLEQTTVMEEALHKELENVTDVNQFILIMKKSTLYRIHMYEQCVRDMFKLDVPLECCLTPDEENVPMELQSILQHYLETKEAIRNVRLEKALPDGQSFTPIKYFTFPSDYQTLMAEYLKFIKKKGDKKKRWKN